MGKSTKCPSYPDLVQLSGELSGPPGICPPGLGVSSAQIFSGLVETPEQRGEHPTWGVLPSRAFPFSTASSESAVDRPTDNERCGVKTEGDQASQGTQHLQCNFLFRFLAHSPYHAVSTCVPRSGDLIGAVSVFLLVSVCLWTNHLISLGSGLIFKTTMTFPSKATVKMNVRRHKYSVLVRIKVRFLQGQGQGQGQDWDGVGWHTDSWEVEGLGCS